MTARKDNRPVVELYARYPNAWTWILRDNAGKSIAEHPHWYSRRADAKRGMERFLRRIGADPARVRWEGK